MPKTMIQTKGNAPEKARTVPVTTQTENGTDNSPVDAYYSFPSSKVTQETTYESRMQKLSDALGNKDEVQG